MIGIVIIILPLAVYLFGAFSVAKKEIKNPDDFFVAFKKVGVTAFSSSSVAYNFQVSTVYPFLLWGASGIFLIPIVNTLCVGLGILLFLICFPRYKKFIGNDETIHGFLGDRYGEKVRVIASYLTIIAFLGFAISETYFGSKVMLSILDGKIWFYFIVAVTLLFVYGYIAYGGQVSSLRTDQLQLIISYIGVFGILLYFFYLLLKNSSPISPVLSWGLLVSAIYVILIFILRKLKFINLGIESKVGRAINLLLNSIVIIAFLGFLIGSVYIFLTRKTAPLAAPFFSLKGFGICGLLSLILLPLSFQFVDLSNWQRLLSVRADQEIKGNSLESNIKKGLLTYAFESPFTWIIFIFFGSLATSALPHFTFTDLLIDIPKNMINSGNLVEHIMGYVFVVSILAIMLSTIDSFIMGMIFTYVYDSNAKTRELLDKRSSLEASQAMSIIRLGKLFGLFIILSGIILFIFFDKNIQNGGELFINLLLSFYTAQLAFLPHVLGILFLNKHPAKLWSLASMIVSAAIGIGVGIYSVIFNPDWAWYPILLCLFTSFTIYIIGYFFSPKQ